MNILFLRGFNNYFNRVIKKYSTLADYQSNSTAYVNFESINFNPNDGIVTELVLGNESQKENNLPLDWENIGTPDYCVCYEMAGSTPAIKSRWYVLESERLRSGQYRLALKRDVIAEHFDTIMNAPCFVEKGYISDNSDPLLFNNEDITFNQIKENEILLKDNTKCGWIIGYVSQDKTRYPSGSTYYESTSPVATYEDYSDVPSEIIRLSQVGTFQRPVARLNTSWGTAAGRCQMRIPWNCLKDPMQYQTIAFTNVPWTEDMQYTSPSTTAPSTNGFLYAAWGGEQVIGSSTYAGTGAVALMNALRFNSTLRNYYISNILTNGEDFSDSTQELINAWNGRYFKHNNKIYQIKYEQTLGRHMGPEWQILGGSTYATEIANVFSNTVSAAGGTFFAGNSSNVNSSLIRLSQASTNQNFCTLAWEVYDASVSFIEVPVDTGDKVKAYIPANRIQACDTPMDVFAIPYSDNFVVYRDQDAETGDPDPSTAFKMSKQVALQAAITLAQAGSNVYDIQILPYFPNPAMIASEDAPGIGEEQILLPETAFVEDTHYNFFYNTSNAPIGIIFWSRTSVFTTNIDVELSLPDQNALTLKESNECDLYRLTSPNYAGSFEFSLAKSGGRITQFNADCTYKPYSPYIHVTPNLAGLYGQRFNEIDDARGLICGGDFSITKIVDQWQQYELQNKNYQAIFDRQIQNMDVNNQIAKEQLEWQTFAGYFGGGITGAVGGAVAGAKAGGGYGALAGAVGGAYMGTVGAIIGGEMDKEWLQRQQTEAKNYTLDMYGYKLGNIKALPIALSKTSAQTNNNKIFPFVEYFTCTNNEKDAYLNKIKYNGMTIMKINTLSNYATSNTFDRVYLKGQLINLDNINDDFHIADSIYQEVNKGFYILQGGN